ncbi:hypothetical protein LCGC14_1413080 [marine sediment metagenome]|uniref:Terminase large subunit gp17-like C-terminal domain-containing protein n=1 Tax=marine sediment metagenome TaxID=412755 RepID=A0A0F9KEQ5_9ZZZZ
MVVAEAPALDSISTLALAARDGDARTYAKAVHRREYELYQDAWAEALETRNRTVIVCPPDTYKSTTVRDFVEREIGKNPNVRILWIMNTGEQAQKQVMAISSTIQSNNIYKAAFDVEEDTEAQWTKNVLFVQRDIEDPDPTLMGTGLNGPYQGLHFNIIIIDDPTDQDDVSSPTTMSSQVEKIRGVIIDRLMEKGNDYYPHDGRIVVILTRWGQNDLVATFADMGFTIYEMPIVGPYPWGPTLSPTRFPMEKVERIHKDKGSILFALTFMCNPQAVKGNIILRDHIAYWNAALIPEHPMQFVMAVDPAASTKTFADYSAIATMGVDIKTKWMYLVDMWAGKVETPDLEAKIVQIAKRTSGLRTVALETVGFQLSFLQGMRRRHQLPFKEIPYRTRRNVQQKVLGLDRDKTGRALYLDALFASGKLFIPQDLPLLDGVSLEDELCSFSPTGSHRNDDRLDSMAIAAVMCESLVAGSTVDVSLRGF